VGIQAGGKAGRADRRGERSSRRPVSKSATRLALVVTDDAGVQATKEPSQGRAKATVLNRTRRSADVTFFLRAVPSQAGWTWRLFARTRASGPLRVVYAASRVYRNQKEASDHGRRALATAWAATAISHSQPSVVRAG
jgi:hypothetical protein